MDNKDKKQFVSKAQERRHRNWLAVRAHFRTGAGAHSPKKHTRKEKHKKNLNDFE